MGLSDSALAAFRRTGHVTVPDVFTEAETAAAIADVEAWAAATLAALPASQRGWYVDDGVAGGSALRKLDNPVWHRPVFRRLAADPKLVAMVESLIGPGVSVYFSQIFFKPPEGGGPKPVHQDNFYFGPNDPNGVVTAWVALDAATTENGCLYFGDGTHHGPVHAHVAPPDEPFNLQIPDAVAAAQPMTAAPVPRGGVSFHHGGTFHQSGVNRSTRWRRACALHYVNHDTFFAAPALPYDAGVMVAIT